MKKTIRALLLAVGLPLLVSAAYWVFDSATLFYGQSPSNRSVQKAVWPAHDPLLLFYRMAMSTFAGVGVLALERITLRNKLLARSLYLSEYAVEHTNAFALIWTNKEGDIIKVNRNAAVKLGYTKTELLQLSIYDVLSDDTRDRWKTLLEEARKEGNSKRLIRQKKKDGSVIDSVVYFQYLEDTGGHYQFSFIADAFVCPLAPDANPTPCGWSTSKLHSVPVHY